MHLRVGAIALLSALTLAACGSSPAATDASPTPTPTPTVETADPAPSESATTEQSPAAESAGGYITVADFRADEAVYSGSDVVLFFNATWCPTCQRAVENLTSEDFPAGLVVVSVDYDTELDLRREYGVTTQHTFVQIDAEGVELAKWTGSESVGQIADKVVG